MAVAKKSENLIGWHEVAIYEAFKANGGWATAKDIAVAAKVAGRTARAHAASLSEIGVLDVMKVFGGYRYRIAENPSDRARAYIEEIEAAKSVLGWQHR